MREDDPSPRIQDEGHRNSGASEVMQQVAPVVDDLRVVHSDCGEEVLGAVRIVLGDWCLSPRGGATAFVIVSEECCCW